MKPLVKHPVIWPESSLFGTAIALLLMATAPGGSAAPITIEFNGVVNSVDAELASQFNLGDLLSGVFTYDSSAPDGDATVNSYGLPADGNATIGSYPFIFSHSIGLRLTSHNAPQDDTVSSSGLATGADVNGLPPVAFNLDLAVGDFIPDINNPPLNPIPLDIGLPFALRFEAPGTLFGEVRVSGITTILGIESNAVPDGGSSFGFLAVCLTALASLWHRRANANTQNA